MIVTQLDAAHLRAEEAPDDIPRRMAFYARLVEGELFLLLEREADGAQITPRVFAVEGGPIVLAFDLESRLSDFTGMPAPYAALPGRALVQMLVQDGSLGLGLNLGETPSARILPPEVLTWLADTLSDGPEEAEGRIDTLSPPAGLPDLLLEALDGALARMAGLARLAYLAGAVFDGGRRGHVLAFVDAAPGAEGALARAVQTALALSGVEAGALDVTFIAATDARAAEFARVGLRVDLPEGEVQVQMLDDPGPGMDPARPPRLR
jgi:hypothetical protein